MAGRTSDAHVLYSKIPTTHGLARKTLAEQLGWDVDRVSAASRQLLEDGRVRSLPGRMEPLIRAAVQPRVPSGRVTRPNASAVPPPKPRPPAPDAVRPRGNAGASPLREFERRQAKRDARIEDQWGTGKLGTIAKFLSEPPQNETSWKKGAEGERRLSQLLNRKLGANCVVLDDRRIRGSKANIDHLVIAPTGVWIVDAKKYKGRIEVVSKLFADNELRIAGRNKTKLTEGLHRQKAAVQRALLPGARTVPFHMVLCFVDGDFPLLSGEGKVNEVLVVSSKSVARLITRRSTAKVDVERVASILDQTLPPA